ncbi:MAG: GDSL-type esterase/lipase family protein [Planctomycetia bacterium]|nr:GDSL-type esterase/lipase family protein [Planctomycetia bacterium]
MKFRSTLFVLLAFLTAPLWADDKSPSVRWERDIQGFEAADKENPPPKQAALFVGASGIRLWTSLEKDFPKHHVINRGFGGSQIADVTHFADRIVLPYKPKLIVLQSGGNDLNAGKTPEQVAEDFQAFVVKTRTTLPETQIVFFSLQPSMARWSQADKQKRANQLIKEQINAGKNMAYVDAWDAFVGPNGMPREELFVADKLHHNTAGYKVRAELLRPYLDRD